MVEDGDRQMVRRWTGMELPGIADVGQREENHRALG